MKIATYGMIAMLFFVFSCKQKQSAPETEAEPVEMLKESTNEPNWVKKDLNKLGFDTTQNILNPLKVGDVAPIFSAATHTGNIFDLKSSIMSKPTVLIFYRGYWCPVCNRYLSTFADSVSLIQQAGAEVIAISPETVENVAKTKAQSGLDIPIISDENGAIAESFGIRFKVNDAYNEAIKLNLEADIAEDNGQSEAYLPIPATYIVDQSGNILYAHVDPNYKNRASVADILNSLK